MDKQETIDFKDLRMDCSQCFGLCCVALYYSASEGFPKDKIGGEPCKHLEETFKCSIHDTLDLKGLHGCMAYECLGAGQRVSKQIYKGRHWRKQPKVAQEMFETFLVVHQIHECLWYLEEAKLRTQDILLKEQLIKQYEEMEALTYLSPKEILTLDLQEKRHQIRPFLMKVSEEVAQLARRHHKGKGLPKRLEWAGVDLRKKDLIGANLSGSLLIATNFSDANLEGATFIGADLRDANLNGAKLEKALYLTQFQINTAKGNLKTTLPVHLKRPSHWNHL